MFFINPGIKFNSETEYNVLLILSFLIRFWFTNKYQLEMNGIRTTPIWKVHNSHILNIFLFTIFDDFSTCHICFNWSTYTNTIQSFPNKSCKPIIYFCFIISIYRFEAPYKISYLFSILSWNDNSIESYLYGDSRLATA